MSLRTDKKDEYVRMAVESWCKKLDGTFASMFIVGLDSFTCTLPQGKHVKFKVMDAPLKRMLSIVVAPVEEEAFTLPIGVKEFSLHTTLPFEIEGCKFGKPRKCVITFKPEKPDEKLYVEVDYHKKDDFIDVRIRSVK